MFTSASQWPTTLNPNYAASIKIFVSPFDTRISTVATSGTMSSSTPVSYGYNSLLVSATSYNMDKLTYPSALIVMAPDPNLSKPLSFSDTATSSQFGGGFAAPVVNPAMLTGTYGTFSNRNRINALYADWHVQALPWATYIVTTSTSQQWTPQ